MKTKMMTGLMAIAVIGAGSFVAYSKKKNLKTLKTNKCSEKLAAVKSKLMKA